MAPAPCKPVAARFARLLRHRTCSAPHHPRPIKLIVQIPCFNEEETLPRVVADIPREVSGLDEVEILVIDDGSSDQTAEVARELGVDHVITLKENQGLAGRFGPDSMRPSPWART